MQSRILEKLRVRARGGASPVDVGTHPPQQGDSIVEAVLQSFINRLKDSSSVIRRAARHVSVLLFRQDKLRANARSQIYACAYMKHPILAEIFLICIEMTAFSIVQLTFFVHSLRRYKTRIFRYPELSVTGG